MTKSEIILLVEQRLPEFMRACKTKNAGGIILHHSAFGPDEVVLLGAAIKYAGMHGKEVVVVAPELTV